MLFVLAQKLGGKRQRFIGIGDGGQVIATEDNRHDRHESRLLLFSCNFSFRLPALFCIQEDAQGSRKCRLRGGVNGDGKFTQRARVVHIGRDTAGAVGSSRSGGFEFFGKRLKNPAQPVAIGMNHRPLPGFVEASF